MVTLEQVEKLREYANISYDEAKTALENADGDILQALIELEQQGKVKAPEGGQYHTASVAVSGSTQKEEKKDEPSGCGRNKSAFKQNMGRFFHWLGEVIHKGNINAFVVERNGDSVMRLPVTALVILLLCAFWVIVPLIVVGLFFSFRYSFQGPDINSSKVNDAMNTVATAAEEIKNDMRKDS